MKIGYVIEKGILRFHAIYWPAMLLSAGVSFRPKFFRMNILTINNRKISKTLGNIINPEEVVEKFELTAHVMCFSRHCHRPKTEISRGRG